MPCPGHLNCNHYKWNKKQMKAKTKLQIFALKKTVQHNILIKITKVLFDTQMISQKILGLDTFFTEWKKSKNRTKAKIAKWHLLASCTSQGELKLGSQIIKFGKYVKLLNSQLSMHSTLWILKKANSKMYLEALPSYRELTEKTLNERTRWNKPFFQVGLWE